MSDVLTRVDHFNPTPMSPSVRSTRPEIQREFVTNVRAVFAAALVSAAVISTSPVLTSPAISHLGSSAAPEKMRQQSLAALTEPSTHARMAAFVQALNEAFDLSNIMVAEDEAAPLDLQTLTYAIEALTPLVAAMELPPPLFLPLQNGGIGAEWHDRDMNVELRFRSPYHVYAVLEDKRRAFESFHGRDPHLVRARMAFREFAARADG